MNDQRESQLYGNAENFEHYHTSEPFNQSNVAELQGATTVNPVTGDYTLTSRDDIILVDTSSGPVVITLPEAAQGREYEVVKAAEGSYVSVVPTNPDSVLWNEEVRFYNRGTAIRFKATTGNWIAI